MGCLIQNYSVILFNLFNKVLSSFPLQFTFHYTNIHNIHTLQAWANNNVLNDYTGTGATYVLRGKVNNNLAMGTRVDAGGEDIKCKEYCNIQATCTRVSIENHDCILFYNNPDSSGSDGGTASNYLVNRCIPAESGYISTPLFICFCLIFYFSIPGTLQPLLRIWRRWTGCWEDVCFGIYCRWGISTFRQRVVGGLYSKVLLLVCSNCFSYFYFIFFLFQGFFKIVCSL